MIQAEGEKTASTALRAASEIISVNPAAMQLRYLQVYRGTGGYLLTLQLCNLDIYRYTEGQGDIY